MKCIAAFIAIIMVACNTNPPATLTNGKWQIVKVEDDKPTTGDLSFDYDYDPARDTAKAFIEFISNSEYIVSNLYDPGTDTNTFQIRGDTLYSNQNPRDYLIITKGAKDTFTLHNKDQLVKLTLVEMKD